jgi:hypothetical protein
MSLKLKLAERAERWRAKMRAVAKLRTHAAINGARLGFGLAVVGGILAVVAGFALVFVPVATFPILDAEFLLILGVILLVVGVALDASD